MHAGGWGSLSSYHVTRVLAVTGGLTPPRTGRAVSGAWPPSLGSRARPNPWWAARSRSVGSAPEAWAAVPATLPEPPGRGRERPGRWAPTFPNLTRRQ